VGHYECCVGGDMFTGKEELDNERKIFVTVEAVQREE